MWIISTIQVHCSCNKIKYYDLQYGHLNVFWVNVSNVKSGWTAANELFYFLGGTRILFRQISSQLFIQLSFSPSGWEICLLLFSTINSFLHSVIFCLSVILSISCFEHRYLQFWIIYLQLSSLHRMSLLAITWVGCSISIICLIMCFISFSIFRLVSLYCQ